jgi:hypothetical protein
MNHGLSIFVRLNSCQPYEDICRHNNDEGFASDIQISGGLTALPTPYAPLSAM